MYSSVNTIWVLVGAALVFLMQAGFAMCEAGFTRAKNTGNILMKNLMDFCIGTPVYWLLGFGLMFGAEEATVGSRLRYSWNNAVDFVRIVRLSLQMLVTGEAGLKDVSGPVGIVSTITQVGTASETIAAAVENILYFGAMLAVNLAVMNMLPIPALDGGKIFFLIIDEIAMKLFRKKIPEKYEMAVNTVGFVALMGFMLVVTFNDVFKLFG